MFGWARHRKSGAPFRLWHPAPGSVTTDAANQFLADVAEIAEDAALVIDGDMRSLISQLTPAGMAKYDSIVQVPGAFPPYPVWAALAAFDALPLGDIFDAVVAKRVETRLLEVASQTRGKLNARLLSALLYRMQRASSEGNAPLDALVLRFWEEVERMGALSSDDCDILCGSPIAHTTLAKRLLSASGVHDKRYGGNFWMTVKAPIEHEARMLGWI